MILALAAAVGTGLCSCSMDSAGAFDLGLSGEGSMSDAMSPGESEDGSGEGTNSTAGMITAGEWNDLDNWGFWNGLMSGQNENKYYDYLHYWSLYPHERYAVTVVDENQGPVCGAKVELFMNDGSRPVWTSITDNRGSAELWYRISSDVDTDEEKTFTISVNGGERQEAVRTSYVSEQISMNTYVAQTSDVIKSADIAFIVDATGSMGDEITFLKDDLLDIITKASANTSGTTLRTAALFYRDEGDEYVTRLNNFSDDTKKTLDFIRQQKASGGGDYPEAVHTALEHAMQKLSWQEGNYARIAFLLLDAPPHYQQSVLDSVRSSIQLYAQKGIKIIPIAASGIDKNTEFLLRLMAIFTDGTYVFITNDSGIGNEHIEPTIGGYQVEQLNDLIIRLIRQYTE